MKTLLIDNYDSYTFNLYQMLSEVNGEEPLVIRNDALDWRILRNFEFDNIVISPGPGRPDTDGDFGICEEALKQYDIPILGVCLGHQGLGYYNGARVVRAPEIMHGRMSRVYHDDSALFKGIPQSFRVVRYHSLAVDLGASVNLVKTAWTEDGTIMGIKHVRYPHWGVQFHPESIQTEYGLKLLDNFRTITMEYEQHRSTKRKAGPSLHYLNHLSVGSRASDQQAGDAACTEYAIRYIQVDESYDPEEVFRGLFGERSCAFWLDSSVNTNGAGRYSFMGTDDGPLSYRVNYKVADREVAIHRNGECSTQRISIFDYLDLELARIRCPNPAPFPFPAGFVGYFGYEMKSECFGDHAHHTDHYDAQFLFADRVIVFDHITKHTYVACLVEKDKQDEVEHYFDEIVAKLRRLEVPLDVDKRPAVDKPLTFQLNKPYAEYISDIAEVNRLLTLGETYEINLTNEISIEQDVDALRLYRNLRRINPAPYSAYIQFENEQILCSSPERFLLVDHEGHIETKPIKGTIRRSKNHDEDNRLKESLRTDEKSNAENLMIVDLLRNDLGTFCEIGSVQVPKLMHVETYETVHQLVSTIKGKIKNQRSVPSCIRSSFPGGSMTGAPKIRSMQIIDKLESRPRGIYSGSIGYLSPDGSADFNIVIRTIVKRGSRMSIGVGGAIVMQSDPDMEFDEIILKAQALLRTIHYTVTGNDREDTFIIDGMRGVP